MTEKNNLPFEYQHIRSKPIKQFEHRFQFRKGDDYNTVIQPGESIRIYGSIRPGSEFEKQFDLTFKVGDHAVYGGSSLLFIGRIVLIEPKFVTIRRFEYGPKVNKLSIYEFCWRNWDYDASRIDQENFEIKHYFESLFGAL